MSLRVGMGQPYGVRCTTPASDDFLPGVPTGAFFVMTKPNGTTVQWPASIESQSADAIAIVYLLSLGDLDISGQWSGYAQYLVAGEVPGPRSEPFQFFVKPPAFP